MKKIFLLILLLTGCTSNVQILSDKPKGKWVWINPALYKQVDSNAITNDEFDHKFVVSKNLCKIESLKVPVPSPSCTQPPRRNCSGLTGFAAGLCSSYTPRVRCDYSSVNAAKNAQVEILKSCMKVAGWEKIWELFKENKGKKIKGN